jgi:hypothetical protein
MKRLTGKLTFANVVASLALFVALGGGASGTSVDGANAFIKTTGTGTGAIGGTWAVTAP